MCEWIKLHGNPEAMPLMGSTKQTFEAMRLGFSNIPCLSVVPVVQILHVMCIHIYIYHIPDVWQFTRYFRIIRVTLRFEMAADLLTWIYRARRRDPMCIQWFITNLWFTIYNLKVIYEYVWFKTNSKSEVTCDFKPT